MKRFFAILLLLLTATTATTAQNVIIGERLPDLSLRRWLMDLEPEQTEYTCYLFYHSESELCKKALAKIKPLIESDEWELGLVTLTEHLDDRIGVAFDLQGRAFRSLEVNFIPFCVICDRKRRALWCGNGATLTNSVLDKILTIK